MKTDNGKISWSQANTFQQCPKKWAYEKLDRIKGEPQEALIHGNEVHNAIETYLKTGEMLPQNKYVYYAENILKMFRLKKPKIEEPLSKGCVRGKADVLGTNILIDFKTSKHNISQMKELTYNQLSLYGYLAGFKNGNTLLEVYPEKAIFFEAEYDESNGLRQFERLERIFGDIQETREHVESAEQLQGSPSKLCGWCPYNNICENNYDLARKRLKK